MAIRLGNKQKLALSEADVLEIRNRFYYVYHSSRRIAEDYPVSEQLIKDAIHGRRGYSRIKDDIPQLTKDNRANDKKNWAQPKSQRIQGKRDMQKMIREGVIPPPPDLIWEPPAEDRFKIKRQEVKPIKFWRDFN